MMVKEWRRKGLFNRLKAYTYHDKKNKGYPGDPVLPT
jgi:hypothetical protein